MALAGPGSSRPIRTPRSRGRSFTIAARKEVAEDRTRVAHRGSDRPRRLRAATTAGEAGTMWPVMAVLCLGVSYRRAPLDLLERLAFSEDGFAKAYRLARDDDAID